jgi:hypothetical protein
VILSLIAAPLRSFSICTRFEDCAEPNQPPEFICRFLAHVLPNGFVKIRPYGLLASGNVPTKLAHARRLLEATQTPSTDTQPTQVRSWQERFLALTGTDVGVCPRCGGQIVRRPFADSALARREDYGQPAASTLCHGTRQPPENAWRPPNAGHIRFIR